VIQARSSPRVSRPRRRSPNRLAPALAPSSAGRTWRWAERNRANPLSFSMTEAPSCWRNERPASSTLLSVTPATTPQPWRYSRGRDAALRRPRPRLAGGKLLLTPNNHAFAFGLRVRWNAFEETVHERIPPLERGGAGPAGHGLNT